MAHFEISGGVSTSQLVSAGVGLAHFSGESAATVRRLESGGAAATGDSEGTSGGTIRVVTSSGDGSASILGTGAVIIRRLLSGAAGYMAAAGVSSGTMRGAECEAEGITSMSGSGAGVIRRLKSKTAKSYDEIVESRALYVGPKKSSFGEVFNLALYCNFQDTHAFTVYLKSDKKRFVASENYHTNESVVNNQAAAGQIEFRQSIVCTPPEGFVGTFFQYKFVKAIPCNGAFEFTGADINYAPRPQLGAEFFGKIESIDNGW